MTTFPLTCTITHDFVHIVHGTSHYTLSEYDDGPALQVVEPNYRMNNLSHYDEKKSVMYANLTKELGISTPEEAITPVYNAYTKMKMINNIRRLLHTRLKENQSTNLVNIFIDTTFDNDFSEEFLHNCFSGALEEKHGHLIIQIKDLSQELQQKHLHDFYVAQKMPEHFIDLMVQHYFMTTSQPHTLWEPL